MRGGIVEKLRHERVSFERFLNDAALNAAAAAVDEADFSQSGLVRFVDIFLDERRDIARAERVKIETVFDRYSKRVLILHCYGAAIGFSYRTVTSVLMPPRTEKSPTTVMRRG